MDAATIFVLVITLLAVGLLAGIEVHSRRRARTEGKAAAPLPPAGSKPDSSSREAGK